MALLQCIKNRHKFFVYTTKDNDSRSHGGIKWQLRSRPFQSQYYSTINYNLLWMWSYPVASSKFRLVEEVSKNISYETLIHLLRVTTSAGSNGANSDLRSCDLPWVSRTIINTQQIQVTWTISLFFAFLRKVTRSTKLRVFLRIRTCNSGLCFH